MNTQQLNASAYSWASRPMRLTCGHRTLHAAFVICDLAAVLLASALTDAIYHRVALGAEGDLARSLGLGAITSVLLIIWLQRDGAYRTVRVLDFGSQVRRLLVTWLGIIALFCVAAFTLKMGSDFSRGATLAFAVVAPAALIGNRAVWKVLSAQALSNGAIRGRRVVLVGSFRDIDRAAVLADLNRHGLEVVKEVAAPNPDHVDLNDLVTQALADVRGSEAQDIIVVTGLRTLHQLGPLRDLLRATPLPVHLIPDRTLTAFVSNSWQSVGSTLLGRIQSAPLSDLERVAKRAFDVIVAGAGLAALAPLMAVTAIAIKLDSPGPVLFRQARHGFNGRPFMILKFRSMKVLEDGPFVVQASRNDARVTRVGRFIRKSSIDELPQLLNVLAGEMSLVGPRPHAVAHDNYYEELISSYAVRHHMKPGLTGLAQVNGLRGETPTLELMAKRIELDLRYVDNWSLWLDIKIIMKTCFELLRSPKAY